MVYFCPIEINSEGEIEEFDVCSEDCPKDCLPDHWKCHDQCINLSKPCGNTCITGKSIKHSLPFCEEKP